MSKRKSTNGSIGERAAEMWFKVNSWKMERTQPETRTVYLKEMKKNPWTGKMEMVSVPRVINCKSDGVADFTGYRETGINGIAVPIYSACEVKEARVDTMPCSRLSVEQRFWMLGINDMCRFVGIYWIDRGHFEMFRFQEKGSYKRGVGL